MPSAVRVLVVEDDRRIAAMLAKGLRSRGHTVDVVATGSEALARLDGGDIDIQVLDLGLPDMDGLDVLRQLAASGSTVPVIAVTARSDPSDREAALELGVAAYITKPFSWSAVWQAVDAAVHLA